jgi:peptidoglycan/LPS O-acetylase OafA/YrhL
MALLWSYGIYLYAFPIQQLMVQKLELRSPPVLFALAVPMTVLCAWLSWKYIESPILKRH